jgi:peptidoglycan/LPS O-acetylase OafA/YrhL
MELRKTVVPGELPVRAESRLPSLDAARFVASLGVIWIHAAAFARIEIADDPGFAGRFALPFFTFTAVLFAADTRRQAQRSFREYALGRLSRLYLPFVGWTVLYLGLKQLRSMALHDGEPLSLSVSVLWDGGSYHLWFLPFLYVLTVAAFAFGRFQSKHAGSARLLLAASWFAGAGIALVPNPFRHYPALALRFGWDVMPAALWAVGFASLRCHASGRSSDSVGDSQRRRAGGWVTFACGVAISVACVAGLCVPGPHVLLANLAGVGCAVAGFSGVRGRVIDHFQGLGSLAFGIYLFHIVPMGLIRGQGPHLHLDPTGVAFALLVMAVATLASIAAARAIGQLRGGAWLILGASQSRAAASQAEASQANHTVRPSQPAEHVATPADLLLARMPNARAG